jgi:AcrR family transcriptional regulator
MSAMNVRRRAPKKKLTPPAHPRASRAVQRQRLIDACISALHLHGPSQTTVGKVVAIAKMSPGIVRFYFDSKDAMMVASLEFLAAEFEARLLEPITAIKSRPVEALARLVELYVGADLASTRKVSVWYSFWGEASSRQEYYDICGSRDAKFETLVRELVGQLILDTHALHFDPDAIALGLIGVLEMLWQSFAFQTESTIDRAEARRRAMAYLRSVFPTLYPREPREASKALPATAYRSRATFVAEFESLFRDAWQFAGLASEVPQPGDFLAVDGPMGPALVVRGGSGDLVALSRVCPQRPHALATGRAGRLIDGITCTVHGLHYGLDGSATAGTAGGPLPPLALAEHAGLLFVRRAAALDASAPALGAMAKAPAMNGACAFESLEVAADWKVLVERWLETPAPDRDGTRVQVLAPHQRVERSPAGLLVLAAVPTGPGRSRLLVWRYGAPSTDLSGEIELAEAIQRGLESPGYQPDAVAAPPPALAAFRQSIARFLPGASPDSGEDP